MKKALFYLFPLLFLASCDWFRPQPEVAVMLNSHFKTKRYTAFDTAAYNQVFKAKLDKWEARLSNPKVTRAFYEAHALQPVLLTRFYPSGALDSLQKALNNSREDGFNVAVFKTDTLGKLLKKLDAQAFKRLDDAYPLIAEAELTAADALLRYHTYMHYGSVNPRRVLSTYYIPVKRPDSLQLDSLLNTTNLSGVMQDAQIQTPAYLSLKKILAFYRDSLRTDDHPLIRSIKVNMERQRWQLPLRGEEMVRVNIPDFSLTWFKNADTLAFMRVCVGAKREVAYAEKIKVYLKTKKLDDKPKNHETPQLISVFNAIQVNPVWNIPVSIAQSEIYFQALKDPFYLSNNNIDVYFKGKKIDDPDTIDWRKYSRETLPFQFKQGAGDGNALGKFKFVFDNSSSIYLHDTNNKNGFRLKDRAISHGCVRIEDPLTFARLLVKDQRQYDNLRMEVNLPPQDTTRNARFRVLMAKKTDTVKRYTLKPTWFATRKNIVVVMDYNTVWVENGKVQFRPDVYAYDPLIWDALKRYQN